MDPVTTTQVITETAAVDAVPLDFSIWGLFMRANIVVKLVMMGLFFASVWSWAIIFDKWWRFARVERRADQFERIFWSGRSLDDLYQEMGHRPQHPLSALFIAAMREWRRSQDVVTSSFVGLKERVDKVMQVTISREMMALESRLLFLAPRVPRTPYLGGSS